MLEQALASAVPNAVKGLPALVETCHHFDCDEPAPKGIRNVVLAAPPSQDVYQLDRVALCTAHLARFMSTGALRLKYHPAETGAKPITRSSD